MQLLRIHYQKLFVCVSFVMLVLVVVRVWEADDGSVGPRQTLSSSLKAQEKKVSDGRENSINIDAPVLTPSRHGSRGGNKAARANIFSDLFEDLAKVIIYVFM